MIDSDGTYYISASQIETYRQCQRKWGWNYIAEIPRQESDSQAFGKEVHAQLEAYLKGESPLDFSKESGYVAATALEHLPLPSDTLTVEGEFRFAVDGPTRRVHFLGYKDVVAPEGALTPSGPLARHTIIDHKTTKDLRWAKTPEVLATDVQATIYAADYFLQVPTATSVILHWNYLTTRKPYKAHPVVTVVTAQEVHKVFLEILDDAEEILTYIDHKATLKVLDLPYDASQCEAYGGCQYRHLCNLSPQERIRSYMSNGTQTVSLLDQLRARAAQPVTTALEAPAPTPAPAMAPIVSINPPESGQVAPAAPVETTVEPPKKRGRPRKNPAPAPQLDDCQASSSLPGVEVNPILPATFVEIAKVLEGFTLYVNCAPVSTSEDVQDGAQLFAKANARIASEKNVADYRFLEFGQGPGALAAAALALHDGSDLVIDTGTPEGQACFTAFASKATRIVRAFR